MPTLALFVEKITDSWAADSFLKITLSDPRRSGEGLRNVYGRLAELREGRQLSLLWRYPTRDVTKNFPLSEAAGQIAGLLREELWQAHLFTRTGDWHWRGEAGEGGRLKASRPALTVAPPLEHDRRKVRSLELARQPFLTALGVTNAAGEARPGMSGKLRQIQRFVELLGHLAGDQAPPGRALRVLDLGSGKGYLTFALAEFLRQRGWPAEITGVELRPELVAASNAVARETGFAELQFQAGAIGEYRPAEAPDWVIALHACNTATDDALFQGLQAQASLLVVAPCCHQEVRPQMGTPPVLEPVLRHGILRERMAEMVTEGLRALLLEIRGYEASVFEFISPEHTGKNLMLAAQRRAAPVELAAQRAKLAALLEFYGIGEQHLARLLGEPAA